MSNQKAPIQETVWICSACGCQNDADAGFCSNCGAQWSGTKDLSVRQWTCPVCGAIHDRDVNAARNILNEGLRLMA